jgi:hypothetical protein
LGERLAHHLSRCCGEELLGLHGGLSRSRREQLVARFRELEGPPVFLLSIKAGGTGLNLTAAFHVIHYDRFGIRRWKTRPPTAPIASASGARCMCTSWCAAAR